jgi:hypothetical protein
VSLHLHRRLFVGIICFFIYLKSGSATHLPLCSEMFSCWPVDMQPYRNSLTAKLSALPHWFGSLRKQ